MRWALAWVFYWLGDLVSKWNDNDRRFTVAGYRLYRWLMLTSDSAQGLGDCGPWSAAASVDTHPKDGDVQQAPLVSGAVPKADAQ